LRNGMRVQNSLAAKVKDAEAERTGMRRRELVCIEAMVDGLERSGPV
jgi:hypothetical protein